MRKKLLIILICFICNSYCHGQQIVDSSSVAFKAQLFTVSEFGIAKKDSIIKYISSQKTTFLKTLYKDFMFIKVDFSQPYTQSDGSKLTLFRNCSYYMGYNKRNSTFYRLGGFDVVDVDIFFNDLKLSDGIMFYTFDDGEIEGMSVQCLYSYYQLSKKKRIKRGFHCFDKCSENTQLYITDI